MKHLQRNDQKSTEFLFFLAELQRLHQDIFTADFFDADDEDHSKEIAEMIRLSKGLRGRDKTGKFRAITRADVKKWVVDPGAEI